MTTKNSFASRAALTVDGKTYTIFRLAALDQVSGGRAAKLPSASRFCSRICCATKTRRS